MVPKLTILEWLDIVTICCTLCHIRFQSQSFFFRWFEMYDMARSQFWRKAVPVVLLLILGRYFWLWLTDLPHPDSQMDMEFVGKVMPICL